MKTKTALFSVASVTINTVLAVIAVSLSVACAAPVEGSVEQADRASEPGAQPAASSSAEPLGDERLGAEQVAVPEHRGPRGAAAAASQRPLEQ